MAAKTFARQPMRVKRVYDPIIAGVSMHGILEDQANAPLDEGAVPLDFSLMAGEFTPIQAGPAQIAAFSLERFTDRNGDAKDVDVDRLEIYQPTHIGEFWLEANLLSGAAGAQVDHVLEQVDLGSPVSLNYDPNYLGAGRGGYYFDITTANSILAGLLLITDFRSTRFVPDNEEGYAVPGDTNAVVRAQLSLNTDLYWTGGFTP